jgi:hypothetical protein
MMEDKLHKRRNELNQQTSTATRPPLPRDASKDGQNNTNKMPSGFIGVWDFGNGPQTKNSPTTGSGKKVY